ncbi:hypothetical protein HG263_04745 [Pseudoalteromonas sp. JBTF-M23]|uniref:Orphan protein n=1 Tax=Pseudoalteromonas caenipelagi TaxID=2726988 RepID=A0A849V929_9GAMM|nr:hypothetical protein [Pseudoalteromonas caenipelagi]NOU49842.1 hypothetical protein [Pseudoalteromonas caenipelagi]
MRNLVLISITCMLVACQVTSDKADVFVGPSNSKQQQFAPLDVLVQAHLNVCDNQSRSALTGYRGHQKLNAFFQVFCKERSTTTQLRLIAQLHQQEDWPQDYLNYFALLHQHTAKLRQYKLNNLALKKQTSAQQQALQDAELALEHLKQKLAQIEQQRLASPATLNNENSMLGVKP